MRWRWRLASPAEALFGPGVSVHVVAVLFPEAGGVGGAEFDSSEPFGAFPEVESGDEAAEGVAVVGGEGFAFPMVGEDAVLAGEFIEWNVDGEAGFAVAHDEAGVGFGLGAVEEGFGGDAGEGVVETGPVGDAVHVADNVDGGHREDFCVGEFVGFIDEAEDFQTPGGIGGIHLGDRAVVEDGPFVGEDLAGRGAVCWGAAERVGADDFGAGHGGSLFGGGGENEF